MKDNSKELREEMNKVLQKFGFTKAICLFEEDHPTDAKQVGYRSLIIKPNADPDPKISYSPHEFSILYQKCMETSKTFREIVNHTGRHMLEEAIGLSELTNRKGKKAD